MLQVARLAPRQLGESTELVAGYYRGQLNADGGFKNRAGASDLYYTVFGLEGLLALRADLPVSQVAAYLGTFADGADLDLVHLAALARCHAALCRTGEPGVLAEERRARLAERIAGFRSADGAFNALPGSARGTLYGCFLALGALEDLNEPIAELEPVMRCIHSLRCSDGGYGNGPGLNMGLTPPTAAAATLLRHFGQPVPCDVAAWLLARHQRDGGFFATPQAPIPDLLSTATALHALAGVHAEIAAIREPCLDFIDSLWSNRGGFRGNWGDDDLDCEYTYYALLALGHLSL
jgi:prenyltransferase beta subunit